MSLTNEAILERLITGHNIDRAMLTDLMERLLSGTMPKTQMAATLAMLRTVKDNALLIATFADIMIKKAVVIPRPDYLFADVVGTGGDGQNTINVSTLASLTAASLGLPIAKHGNVSVSSQCGSADVLTELGINISLPPARARLSLDEHRWCFLYAPLYHVAFKSVKEVRAELRIKTIFNVLGPLANPLLPPVMLVGVYDPELILPFAKALKDLGRTRALVVHGAGLDEIALHGPTNAAFLSDGVIEELLIKPDDLGLSSYGLEEIRGGHPRENAKLCQDILAGKANDAKIAMVAASAGALLWMGEKAQSLREGVEMAKAALLRGEPLATLASVKRFSNGTP